MNNKIPTSEQFYYKYDCMLPVRSILYMRESGIWYDHLKSLFKRHDIRTIKFTAVCRKTFRCYDITKLVFKDYKNHLENTN